MEKKQVTVGELIAQLQVFDKSKRVWVEGCDCCPEGYKVVESGDGVLIANNEGRYYE